MEYQENVRAGDKINYGERYGKKKCLIPLSARRDNVYDDDK